MKTNKERICYIVGAGEFYQHHIEPNENDYVIAVDGGYCHLHKLNCRIDLVIGDFDSMTEIPNHPNIVQLKKEKDDTDMIAAIKCAIELGYEKVYIYGGCGGRFDHTQANVQSLVYLSKRDVKGYLFGKDTIITAVTNGSITFDENEKGMISVFSHTDKSVGVEENGLKYELCNATLTNDFPLGVSNEFIGVQSSISVKEGTLMIHYQSAT